MAPLMHFDIVSIFPDLLLSPLEEGIIRQARKKGQIKVEITNLRDYAEDRHHTTDDRPFGGGEGMVMKADVLGRAVAAVSKSHPETHRVLLSPQGTRLNQKVLGELAGFTHLTLVCGRYEGVDNRFVEKYIDREISLGDYIISGGELGAMILVDGITRILPGVLGSSQSVSNDTFENGLLKHPQFTRPREFEGEEVPAVLLSGNHEEIKAYRFIESVRRTLLRRPELLKNVDFDKRQIKLLRNNNLYAEVKREQENITGGNER